MQGRGQQRKLSNCSDLLPGLKPTYNLAATIAYCSAVSCDSALSKAMSTEAGDDLPHERRARNSQSCRECGVLSSCSPRELSCCSLISTVKSEFERVQEVACKSQEGAQTWLSRVTIATTHRQQLVEDARVHRRHVETSPTHTAFLHRPQLTHRSHYNTSHFLGVNTPIVTVIVSNYFCGRRDGVG